MSISPRNEILILDYKSAVECFDTCRLGELRRQEEFMLKVHPNQEITLLYLGSCEDNRFDAELVGTGRYGTLNLDRMELAFKCAPCGGATAPLYLACMSIYVYIY